MYKWESLLVINNEHLSSNSHHLNGGAICPNTIRRKGSNNPGMGSAKSGARRKVSQGYLVFVIKIACPPWISMVAKMAAIVNGHCQWQQLLPPVVWIAQFIIIRMPKFTPSL